MKKILKKAKTGSFVKVGVTYFFYIYTRPFYRYYSKKYSSFYKRFSPFTRPLTLGIRQCDRRTVVDFKRGFLFNRITKVASSALMATLRPGPEAEDYKKNHTRPSRLGKDKIKEVEKLFKFAFVRNPYDRILSSYLHHMETTERRRERFKKPVPGLFKKYGEKPTFYEFCRFLEEGGLYKDKHLAPQISLLSLPPEEFDFIGKFENIEEDFSFITTRVKSLEDKSLKRGGTYTGASDKRRKYYDSKTADIVSRLYKDDFKRLDYSENL
ncbi:MAG: sulfotransferase family protein [Elusimicrobiota bacterium]